MTSRTLIVLAAALVVLALAAVWGQRGDAPPSDVDAPFLPGLEAALGDIDRVRVVGAGNETLATLERRTDNWVVAEKQGYPADIAKIRGALRALAEARIIEQKTANPEYYDRLGVESVESEDASGVQLIAYAGEDPRASVIIGDSDAANSQYVRASDAETSYLVDRKIDVPRDAVGWIDGTIMDVSSSRVASVTIEHPDGETVRITKNDQDDTNFTVENVPEGRELSYPGVANVLANTLRGLRLDDVAAAEAELPDETTRTTFRTFDGLVVTATSYTRDDEQWVRFEASVDEAANAGDEGTADDAGASGGESSGEAAADASDDAGTAAADAAGADAADAADADSADEDDAGVDVHDEAERINARVSGWEYRIPSYLYGQLTRRMEDLLRDVEDDDAE